MKLSLLPLPCFILAAFAISGCQDSDNDTPPDEVAALVTDYCDQEQEGFNDRPSWTDIPHVPDMENFGSNFDASVKSLRMVASALNKATQTVENVRHELDAINAAGECNCLGDNEEAETCIGDTTCDALLSAPTPRESCNEYCDALGQTADTALGVESCGIQPGTGSWRLNDLYKSRRGQARKALDHVEWLDNVANFINGDAVGNILQAVGEFTERVEDTSQDITNVLGLVNRFGEGFHIGAYNKLRADLWYCVPRLGSGVYAPIADSNWWSLGARFTSGLASKGARGQFALGGANIRIRGFNFPIMPGAGYSAQMNPFPIFHRSRLFGLDIPSEGLPVADNGWQDMDVFGLFSANGDGETPSQIQELAGSDGVLSIQDLLYTPAFPFDYTSSSGQELTWPRADDISSVERRSIAQFGAGFDWHPRLRTPIHKELPTISYPPSCTGACVSVTPFFGLDAGLDFYHQHNLLRDQITSALGLNLLEGFTHDRNDEDMQAPDSSFDVGAGFWFKPKIGADVFGGFALGKRIRFGVTLSMALKLALKPRFISDTYDGSLGVSKFLDEMPSGENCTPVVEKIRHEVCITAPSDKERAGMVGTFHSPDTQGSPQGTLLAAAAASYSCVEGDPLPCENYGYCTTPEGFVSVTAEIDCRDHFRSFTCVEKTQSEVVSWEGDCSPLSAVNSVASQELEGPRFHGLSSEERARLQELTEESEAQENDHAIFSYAASEMTFEALFDAAAGVDLYIRFFGRERKFRLFRWSDAFDIGSKNTFKLQKGLEVTYGSECTSPGQVINHQPDELRRIPSPGTPAWSDYDNSDKLVEQCLNSVDSDTSYDEYLVPTNDALLESIGTAVDESGSLETMALEMFTSTQMCVGNTPLTEWLTGDGPATLASEMCRFRLGTGSIVEAPCGHPEQLLLQNLGCLSGSMLPENYDVSVPVFPVDGFIILDHVMTDELHPTLAWDPQWQEWKENFDLCAKQLDNVESLGLVAGTPKITPCCGNGNVESHEECEAGEANCTEYCTLIECGDGRVEGDEFCDDGNDNNNDECTNQCTAPCPAGSSQICTPNGACHCNFPVEEVDPDTFPIPEDDGPIGIPSPGGQFPIPRSDGPAPIPNPEEPIAIPFEIPGEELVCQESYEMDEEVFAAVEEFLAEANSHMIDGGLICDAVAQGAVVAAGLTVTLGVSTVACAELGGVAVLASGGAAATVAIPACATLAAGTAAAGITTGLLSGIDSLVCQGGFTLLAESIKKHISMGLNKIKVWYEGLWWHLPCGLTHYLGYEALKQYYCKDVKRKCTSQMDEILIAERYFNAKMCFIARTEIGKCWGFLENTVHKDKKAEAIKTMNNCRAKLIEKTGGP